MCAKIINGSKKDDMMEPKQGKCDKKNTIFAPYKMHDFYFFAVKNLIL